MKCIICGKKLKKNQKICCSHRCIGIYSGRKRTRKPYRLSRGYKLIYHPDHKTKTKFRSEHVLVMEGYLKRKIKRPEQVHHIDMDKLNNIIKNLCLCKNESEHTKIHKSMEKIVIQLLKSGKVTFNKRTKTYKLI